MNLSMLEYYNLIKENNINIIYSGPIWGDGVEGIGGTIRKRLEFDELPLTASKSVFTVFIEQMNNMLMYSAERNHFSSTEEKDFDVSAGVFIMGARDKVYFLKSGNVIRDENVELLKSRIDHLNNLDKDGLKKLYKEQIRSDNTNPESKGGGIGLTEIARRATSKIIYDFQPYGEGLSFFSMEVSIGTADKEKK